VTGVASAEPLTYRAGDPSARAGAIERRHTRIVPQRGWPKLGVNELVANRGLLRFLVWRDIKVRYAQTVLGATWAVIQPVFTMLIFTVVFGRIARIPSDGVPYAVFSLAALVPWTYFSTALGGASNSLVGSAHLITKVYFPRLMIPAAPLLAGLMDFAIAFAVLLAVLLAYGRVPSVQAVAVIPVGVAIMMATAAGVGCWLAALQLRYRDVRYVTTFLLQIWMYLSPVVYPSSAVPPRYRWAFYLNPLVGVIDGFRAVLLGTTSVPWAAIGRSLTVSSILLVAGTLYFRRAERSFADVA
jgi:lipopolysaccharide transport system permease protein